MQLIKKLSLKTIIRVVISCIMVALILRVVHLNTLIAVLSDVSLESVALIITLYAVGQMLSAWKWRVLLHASGIRRPFAHVLRSYYLGMFVNTFGLGTVGGDIARALALLPIKGERAKAIATVIADRAQGLVMLILIGATAVLIFKPPFAVNTILIGSLIFVCTAAPGWFLGPKLITRFMPQQGRIGSIAHQVAGGFPQQPSPLLFASALSISFHLMQIYMHYIIAQQLHADIPLAFLLASVPFVNALSTLPISVNGIGVREGGYIFFFSTIGISNEISVAMGAIWIITITVVSAIGGLIAALSSSRQVTHDIGLDALSGSEVHDDVKREVNRCANN